MSSFVEIGRFTASGVQTVATQYPSIVVEYPTLTEGGVTEYMGMRPLEVRVTGFLYSGADDWKDVLLSFSGTRVIMVTQSLISGNSWELSGVLIKEVFVEPPAGRNYPFYTYMIRGVLGTETNRIAKEVLFQPIALNAVTYVRSIVMYATPHPSYTRNIELKATPFPDYTRNISMRATPTPSYSRNISFMASPFANYVRMS